MARYTNNVSGRYSRKRTYADESMYVYGNTVPKPQEVPDRRERVSPGRPHKTSRQIRKNRKRALGIGAGYVVFLTAAALIGLVVCVQFLGVRSEVTKRSENITVLKQELVTLKEENTTQYNAIMDSVNLEEVRNRAVNELGMVYAQPGQIIEYENPSDDYVKQYEEIPEGGILAASQKVSE